MFFEMAAAEGLCKSRCSRVGKGAGTLTYFMPSIKNRLSGIPELFAFVKYRSTLTRPESKREVLLSTANRRKWPRVASWCALRAESRPGMPRRIQGMPREIWQKRLHSCFELWSHKRQCFKGCKYQGLGVFLIFQKESLRAVATSEESVARRGVKVVRRHELSKENAESKAFLLFDCLSYSLWAKICAGKGRTFCIGNYYHLLNPSRTIFK